jgi:hypothetical protein
MPGWNGSFLKQADIDKLPIKAFAGTLDPNYLDIQVTGRKHLPD